jgi:hypothetical protein
VATIAVLGMIFALAFFARMEDPASTPVIPAEDPYTHMALLRGHLADGRLDPLVPGGTLYPPGMHAVLAGVHAYTGLDLQSLFRYGPILFGTLSVVGVALLLWRLAGATAAVVGALGAALGPELMFRTTMMAPTAVDLAIIPFIMLMALEAMRGRWAWWIPMAAASAFLVVAHPWALMIVTPAVLGTVLVGAFLVSPPARLHARGSGLMVVVTGVALIASTLVCWSNCGMGFQDVSGRSSLDRVALLVGVVAVVLGGFLAVAGRRIDALPWLSRGLPTPLRWVAACAMAGTAVGIGLLAADRGFPDHVHLVRMFGWPVLALAVVGLVATPLLRTRAAWAGWAGFALATVTFPFVVFNPLASPFWPHRTAAYLGIGLVVLAGCGAAGMVTLASAAVRRMGQRRRSRLPARGAAVGAIALVAVMLGGTVYAATPPAYESGWYRLYHECEYEALQGLANQVGPRDIIVAGDWRSKLVLAAFSHDSSNVWYSEAMFKDPNYREKTLVGLALDGRAVYVVIDRHVLTEHPDYDTTFVRSDDWSEQGAYCSEGVAQARLSIYRSEVEP